MEFVNPVFKQWTFEHAEDDKPCTHSGKGSKERNRKCHEYNTNKARHDRDLRNVKETRKRNRQHNKRKDKAKAALLNDSINIGTIVTAIENWRKDKKNKNKYDKNKDVLNVYKKKHRGTKTSSIKTAIRHFAKWALQRSKIRENRPETDKLTYEETKMKVIDHLDDLFDEYSTVNE